MLGSVLGRLRFIGVAEGVSYLVLLFIAMPLKYLADAPLMNKWVGWAHGLLFTLYLPAVLHAAVDRKWSIGKTTVALLASLFPFATFILEPRWRREQFELEQRLESIEQTSAVPNEGDAASEVAGT